MQNNQPSGFPTSTSGRPLLFGCLAVVILFSVFAIGFGVGLGMGRLGTTPSIVASTGTSSTRSQIEGNFGVFWEAMDILYRDFYGELPVPNETTFAAIRGVISTLDDQHTSFLTPQEAEHFRSNMTGEFDGIGARVDWDEETDELIIVEPYENQPAWNAGVRRDDRVTAIDGVSIKGLDLSQAVEKIRGPRGEKVTLTIRRRDVVDLFDVVVTRDTIEIPTIRTDSLGSNGEIAYVGLFTFNENAGQLVRQAVQDAQQRKPMGIILDLRGNSGGLLREAVKVTNVFLQDQNVVIERFKDGKVETYEASEDAIDLTTPLVILVNENSASASEIVAGALQDAKRGTLVGAVTFGKGSVQLPQTLSDGSIVRVTIAHWFTPNDRTINGTGLEPDVLVALTDADRDARKDPQLDAAVKKLSQ